MSRRAARVIDPAAAREIETHIAGVEARCGVEIVCAVYRSADAYPEAPWFAFAFGTVVSALVVVWAGILAPAWTSATSLVIEVALILGAGATCGALAMLWPRWALLFVDRRRQKREARRRAEELFFERALHSTSGHTAVLVFASVLERKIEIIPDRGFRGRVPAQAWKGVVSAMIPRLRAGECGDAFIVALDAIEKLLVLHGFSASGTRVDELPNALIQGRGA